MLDFPLSSPVLAANASWPDGFDGTLVAVYILLAIGLPVLGYVFMVLDYRAYLRSLRRALVVAKTYVPTLPDWIRRETPRCILALDLTMPCTADDIRAAYRRKVKELHPDLGGDRRKFLRLQAHFEQALDFVDRQ